MNPYCNGCSIYSFRFSPSILVINFDIERNNVLDLRNQLRIDFAYRTVESGVTRGPSSM